jgi:hypothetical protein
MGVNRIGKVVSSTKGKTIPPSNIIQYSEKEKNSI